MERCTGLGEAAGVTSVLVNTGLKVSLGQRAAPSSLCIVYKANALFKHAPPSANRKRKATTSCCVGLGAESCNGCAELGWEGRRKTRADLQWWQ